MPRIRDTSEAARARQRDALRAMSGADRLAIAAALSDEVRELAAAGIRARLPADSEAHLASALARIVLGRDLADAADRMLADPIP